MNDGLNRLNVVPSRLTWGPGVTPAVGLGHFPKISVNRLADKRRRPRRPTDGTPLTMTAGLSPLLRPGRTSRRGQTPRCQREGDEGEGAVGSVCLEVSCYR